LGNLEKAKNAAVIFLQQKRLFQLTFTNVCDGIFSSPLGCTNPKSLPMPLDAENNLVCWATRPSELCDGQRPIRSKAHYSALQVCVKGRSTQR